MKLNLSRRMNSYTNVTNLPKVSIVICNFKNVEDVIKCVKSILKTNYPDFEVLIVDCLTKNIEKIIKSNVSDRRVKVVHFDVDIGSSEAHNVGFKNSDPRSTYVAFLDNDTEVDPNWLMEAIKVFQQYQKVGAVQSKLLLLDNRKVYNGTGDFIDYHGFAAGNRGRLEIDDGQYDKIDEIFSPRGAAFVVRKDVYKEIGGMDPDFFVYVDDIDLGWRIWLSGHRVMFAYKSVVYHRGAATIKKSQSSRIEFHRTKNKYMMLLKNFELKNCRYILLHLFEDLLFLLYAVYKQDISLACGKLKAIIWIIKNLKSIQEKRMYVQYRVRKVSDSFLRSRVMVKPIPFGKRLMNYVSIVRAHAYDAIKVLV